MKDNISSLLYSLDKYSQYKALSQVQCEKCKEEIWSEAKRCICFEAIPKYYFSMIVAVLKWFKVFLEVLAMVFIWQTQTEPISSLQTISQCLHS